MPTLISPSLEQIAAELDANWPNWPRDLATQDELKEFFTRQALSRTDHEQTQARATKYLRRDILTRLHEAFRATFLATLKANPGKARPTV